MVLSPGIPRMACSMFVELQVMVAREDGHRVFASISFYE